MSEEIKDEEITVETKTQEERDAEQDGFASFRSFGSSPQGEQILGTTVNQPKYKEEAAFDPPDAPGSDPLDLLESCRGKFRAQNPSVQAKIDEKPAEPNKLENTNNVFSQPSTSHIEESVVSTSDNNIQEESTSQEKEDEETGGREKMESGDSNTFNGPEGGTENDDPIFCPYCGQELTKQTLNGEVFYCHTAEQGCEGNFSSIEEIEKIMAQKEARKKALEDARAAEAKKKAKQLAKEVPSPSPTTPSTTVPSEIYVIFSNQLAGIVKTLAEIQARDTKLDSLANDLAEVKRQLDELKQEKDTVNLPDITSKLTETAESMCKAQANLSENLAATVDLKETIGKLKEGGRELLMITDNAGGQFVQYMNAVKQMDKYSNRIKFVLPKVEEYLQTLEECYENLTKRYAKDQKDFGEHFRKQTQSFFKEASKKMVFSKTASGAPGMTSMIIPTFIAFVLMFLLHMLTK